MISSDRVYLSGAITGIQRQHYIERFKLAEKLLRDEGYSRIVNPVRVWACRWPWLFKIMGYRFTLLYDLWLLTRCQRIYKIPSWQKSRGANIESAVSYNLDIYLIPKDIRHRIDLKLEKLIQTQEKEGEEQGIN